MEKVQLGIRIPKDLDTQIENVARYRSTKKQELVTQLLMHGLAAIGNLHEVSQERRPNNRLERTGSSFSSPNQTFSGVSNLEDRLAYLESKVGNFSQQLTEIKELIRSAISGLVHTRTYTTNARSVTSTSHSQQSEQKLADQAEDLGEPIPVSKAGNHHLTESIHQAQELPSPSTSEVNQDVVLFPKDSNLSPSSSELDGQAEEATKDSDWLTLKEAYDLAKEVGYQNGYRNFAWTLLDSPNAEQKRLEWGFELDIDSLSKGSTKRRSIRLRLVGKILQALQASPEERPTIDFSVNKSSTSNNPICPNCGKKMCKNGLSKGEQLYRCSPCHRSNQKSKPEAS